MQPDQSQIDDWKRTYGHIYAQDEYIFRLLTLREYDEAFHRNLSTPEIEEQLFLAAVLWPVGIEMDGLPAGVISSVANQITSISGFADPKVAKNLLTTQREEAQNVFTLAKAMILSTMPAYTEEQLSDLTFRELLHKVALAEEIIKVQQAIMRAESAVELGLVDPEEEEVKANAQARKHNAMRKDGQAVYGDPIADRLRQMLG